MRVPNADKARIERRKISEYLLNPGHKRGGTKARLLLSFGYKRIEPGRLESDLRAQHLVLDVAAARMTEFGERFEIWGPILTPGGRRVTCRSIWQIDLGTEVPRLITMYPD
jgi:hypothetical protein